MKKLLVSGAGGFVGARIMTQLAGRYELCAFPKGMLAAADEQTVADWVRREQPDVIVHTAALSDTGYSEKHPDESYRANVLLPCWMAAAAQKSGAKLVAFSSDQVYTGLTEHGPFDEDTPLSPANVYGRHKQEMEQRVLDILPDAVLLRAAWMYDLPGYGLPIRGNFLLNLLTAVEEMTKSGYMPNYGVEAGQRMVMCQTGNAMIFGKAMPLFENNFKKNNAALEANDGTAVENSLTMDYAFLPVPTMDGCAESCYGTVDGLIAMRNKNTTDEHLKNVLLFMDYICSGERIATCMNELYLDPVCQSGRDALVLEEGRDADNLATAARCIAMVQAPPEGVTTEMTATAKKLMDEQIVPKFQLLLSGETTAQEVYDHICEAAYAAFGEENCVSGKLG